MDNIDDYIDIEKKIKKKHKNKKEKIYKTIKHGTKTIIMKKKGKIFKISLSILNQN